MENSSGREIQSSPQRKDVCTEYLQVFFQEEEKGGMGGGGVYSQK